MNKYLSHIILIFALFAGLGEVYAQTAPEPGTEIPNIVSTTYTEADTNTDVEVYSNEVLVTVQDNPEFSFFPNESYKDFRGTQFEITHFVRNDGNTVADILVKGYNAAEDDDYDIQNLSWTNSQVYKTVANSDTITTQVELQPGQTLEISYSGEISVNEDRDTLTAVMIFEATDLRTGKTLYVYDDIGIKIGAIVDIQKEQTGDAVKTQGDTFTYRIMGENVGDMTALPRDIIIDGIESNQVILIDSVPNNLTFQQFGTFDKGFPLYHVVGAGEREFSSTLPDDLGSVDVIGVGFDSLQVGETFDINFDVRINDNATGDITNVAQLTYVDPEGTVTTVAASNLVAATLPEMGAGIDYYTNEDFEQKTSTSSIGELLHIQADASVCNENRSVIETVTIDLTSDLTGDMERFTGIETGPNTGVFRIPNEVPTRDGSENEVVPYNEILETVEDDIIIAQLGCNAINQGGPGGGGGPVEIFAQVAVDPYGIVFDSETNEVVEGAEVRIIDVTGANNGGNPGGPATVYTANGVGITDNIQISGVRGKYRFPFLLPGTYRLDVIAPEGYEFASDVPVDSLDPTRKVDLNASYGQEFEIVNNPAGLDFDIPLDPLALGVLFVNKTVDRKAAGVGDFVNYSIEIRSQAVNTVNDLILYDNLPFGFTYQTGTARLDGQSIADPTGGTGPALEFDLGSIDPGQTMTLTYRVYIGIGAERGDGVNTARVQSDGVIVRTSNDAKVKIEVTGGAFNDDAFIVGKVFLDCNEDNMQDASEPGIPGVRLYLENGNYVITDSEGKYTFYAIKPNKHVLKLDNYSLPEGSKLKVLDNRHAFDPSSRFVDVTKGEMHRADFAVCECSEATFAEIKRRADLLDGTQKSNLETSMSQSFSLQERSAVSSRGSYNQASGTVGSAKALELNATPGEKVEAVSETMIDTTVSESNPVEDIEQALMNADDGTDFLNIADGDTVKTDQITLLAKGTKGTVFDVFINDEVVSSDRIGQRSVLTNRKLQVWEFVSVSLQPGTNSIRLVETDPFGNIRGEKVIQVHTPGKLATLDMTVPRNNVSADGVSTAIVRIELLDENGINIGARLPVTLDVSFGTWKVEDVNEKEPGTQVFIEGGVAEFELQSTIEPNTSKVRAYVGEIYDEAKVEFLPDLRPMLAAGILEGTVRLRDPLNINQNVENDGFERELKQLSYNFNSLTADARFAFFLKGKVSGKTLLTAAYDTEKDKEERLFRDIRPDEFYPLYGESSVKGFDAQSSGRLYVRLDRGKTYALYGDFITMDNDPDIQIGAYNRSQNGVKTHLEKGAVQIDAFGVSSASSRRIEEFQGQGISRYELPDRELIDNSEIIEIVTYDREQPNVILSRERLTRFVDYAIDPFSGVLTMKNPVFSVDSEYNPVFIRATYEVTNSDESYMIGGVSGNVELTDGFNVGAGIVQDNNPENAFTMATGNASLELGRDTKIIAEYAHTITDENGAGNAGRIEVQHSGKNYEVRAQVGKSDENFDNQGATLGQARTEARARARYKVTSSTNLNGEFMLTRDDTTGNQTIGSLVNVQQQFGDGINASVGVRHSEQTNSNSGNTTNTNLTSKLTAKLPFVKGASTFGEYEQDLNAADRKMIAVGGDYKISNIAKAYARHEFVSSAGGRYTLNSNAQRNNTVFGLDASFMQNGKVFSEYRLGDALDGRTGQASIGLRNRFRLSEGLGLNAGFERVFTVQGPAGNDGTAISTSLEYTGSARWKGSARAEARFGSNTNTYLNSLGYGLKINHDWTFLGRNIMAISTGATDKLQERLQLGAAFRDTETNMFDALFRYEFKYETNEQTASGFMRTAHVFSSHANVHPTSEWIFSGRLASKYSLEKDDLTRSTSFLNLAAGRALYDINERWDAALNASLLTNSDFTSKNYGLGVEVGYIMATNLRLATGFNFFGYEDEDLAANNYTQPGAYAGFSYKFDEQVFRTLAPERSANFIDEKMYLTCMPCQMPTLAVIDIEVPEHSLNPVAIVPGEFDYKPMRIIRLPRQVHFDNDKSFINPTTAQMLDKVAKFLIDRENYVIDLTGFTDMKASVAYNKALSLRRSRAVRAYLLAAGVTEEKLTNDGRGEIDAKGQNAVEMSLERKVRLELNQATKRVSFIDQVEDLQVQQKAKNIGGWDYIFKSEHNAVPANMNLRNGAKELTYLNKYLVQRIAIAMREYPEIYVNIALPADDRFFDLQNQILNVLSENQADISRYMFRRVDTGSPDLVKFTYSKAHMLEIFEQNDDIKFHSNKNIPELIESLLRVLNSREDYELIHDLSQTYVVPDRVLYSAKEIIPGNETQAVLSRVGSYLRNNPFVFLELRGDGSTKDDRRIRAIIKYLTDWGIDEDRITIGDNNSQTNNGFILMEYRNADSINLFNTEIIYGYEG